MVRVKREVTLLSLLCFHVLLVSVLDRDVMSVRKDKEEKFLGIDIRKGGGFGGGFGGEGGAGGGSGLGGGGIVLFNFCLY